MKVRFWGARGSLPTPLDSAQIEDKIRQALLRLEGRSLPNADAVEQYIASLPPLVRGTVGGNTTCVSVETGSDEVIVFDMGSGARKLSEYLLKGLLGKGQGVAHIFMSHLHWDHVMGFPFFVPAYIPGNHLIFYSPHEVVLERYESLMNAPHAFPVDLDYMRAKIEFVRLNEGETVEVAGAQVTNILQSHPGNSYGYRVDANNGSFVFSSDIEIKVLSPRGRDYINFIRDADVLVFDSQYALSTVWDKRDWGHSSPIIGKEIAMQAGISQLVLTHHDPANDDQKIEKMLRAAREYMSHDETRQQCEVLLAQDGLELSIGRSRELRLETARRGDVLVISTFDSLDSVIATELEAKLGTLLKDTPPAGAVLDMSGVTNLDMRGLKALMMGQQRVRSGSFAIVGLREEVRLVLQQTDYLETFEIYDTLEEAVEALEARLFLLLPGQLLHKKYRIEGRLGGGKWEAFYKAYDIIEEREVAVKILSPRLGDKAGVLLEREAEMIGKLQHPNIAAVYDLVRDSEHTFLIREYLAGHTLRETLGDSVRSRRITSEEAYGVALDILRALEYAHERGVLHLSLRSRNVLVSNRAKLVNFGVPQIRETPSLAMLAYMAPEQLRDIETDERTDLYAYGVLLYEIYTGRRPFAATNHAELWDKQLHQFPPSPRKFNPKLSRSLEFLILKLLAKNPDDRYATATEVRHVLENLQAREAPEPVFGIPIEEQPRRSSSLIGRAHEYRQLQEYLEEVWSKQLTAPPPPPSANGVQTLDLSRNNVPILACLEGTSGIDKTVMAEELANYVYSKGGTVLVGHCYDAGGRVPYQPFVEALRNYVMKQPVEVVSAQLGAASGELIKLIPEINQLAPALVPGVSLEPKRERMRLFHSITSFLHEVARATPALLILDNLQAADNATLELLRYLMRNIFPNPLFIVATFRPVEPEHPLHLFLQQLSEEQLYRITEIPALTHEETVTLAEQWLETDIYPCGFIDTLATQLYENTNGNPLHTTQALLAMLAQKQLYKQDGVWQRDDEQKWHIPASVDAAIAIQADQLDPKTREVLSMLAGIGKAATLDLLVRASGMAENDILSSLDEALVYQIIKEVSIDHELVFRHNSFREYLYNGLSTTTRCEVHQSIVKALQSRDDDSVEIEQLAYHSYRAGGEPLAFKYLLQAGDKAQKIYAHHEALGYYEQALVLTDDVDQRYDILMTMERLHDLIGQRTNQRRDLEQLQVLVAKVPSASDRADFYNRLSRFHSLVGEYSQAQAAAETAVIEAHEDAVRQLKSFRNLGYMHWFQGKYQEALSFFKTALSTAQELGDREQEVRSWISLADVHRKLGNYSQALQSMEQALDTVRAAGNKWQQVFVLTNLGRCYGEMGRYYDALHITQSTLKLSRDLGDQGGVSTALNMLGTLYLKMGQHREALTHYQRAWRIVREIESSQEEADILVNVGTALLQLRQYTEAQTWLKQAYDLADQLQAPKPRAWAAYRLSILKREQQKYETALIWGERAVEQAQNFTDVELNVLALANRGMIRYLRGNSSTAMADTAQAGELLKEQQGTISDNETVYFYHYRVLQANMRDADAKIYLQKAYKALMEKANKIGEDEWRKSYLTKIPLHRTIAQEWEVQGRD